MGDLMDEEKALNVTEEDTDNMKDIQTKSRLSPLKKNTANAKRSITGVRNVKLT